jgi:hypothetical protein
MKARKAVLLGLAVFLLVLLFVLPASWVAAVLPTGVQCGQWGGSVWRGQCIDLTVSDGGRSTVTLDSLHWKVTPLALLRFSLAADFQGAWPQGAAAGHIVVRPGGSIRLRGLTGRSLLDQKFFAALPAGWNGSVDLRELELDWHTGSLDRLGGELEVHDLFDARGMALGSYRLEFPPSSTLPFTGQLRDTGGPVEVDATLQLTAERAWSLEGRMRVRDPADELLNRRLDMLNAAGADGWRRLSAAGHFN